MSNPYSRIRREKRRRQQDRFVAPPGLFDFLIAYDHDDLPDGAWQAMIEDGVKDFNDEFGAFVDPYEGFMAYVEQLP